MIGSTKSTQAKHRRSEKHGLSETEVNLTQPHLSTEQFPSTQPHNATQLQQQIVAGQLLIH